MTHAQQPREALNPIGDQVFFWAGIATDVVPSAVDDVGVIAFEIEYRSVTRDITRSEAAGEIFGAQIAGKLATQRCPRAPVIRQGCSIALSAVAEDQILQAADEVRRSERARQQQLQLAVEKNARDAALEKLKSSSFPSTFTSVSPPRPSQATKPPPLTAEYLNATGTRWEAGKHSVGTCHAGPDNSTCLLLICRAQKLHVALYGTGGLATDNIPGKLIIDAGLISTDITLEPQPWKDDGSFSFKTLSTRPLAGTIIDALKHGHAVKLEAPTLKNFIWALRGSSAAISTYEKGCTPHFQPSGIWLHTQTYPDVVINDYVVFSSNNQIIFQRYRFVKKLNKLLLDGPRIPGTFKTKPNGVRLFLGGTKLSNGFELEHGSDGRLTSGGGRFFRKLPSGTKLPFAG